MNIPLALSNLQARSLYFLWIAALYLCSSSLSGQEFKEQYHDWQVNFYQVTEAADQFFQSSANGEGTGFKGYWRWRHANEAKFFPDGERSQLSPYLPSEQYQRFKAHSGQSTSPPWRDMGPYRLDSITGHYSPGLGRVECFYVNPSDTDQIYLGSRSGGFWRSDNGGQSWQASTTDFLPASGVNTLTVSPTEPDSILINIRNADNGTSHGVYRSTDGGNTWTLSNFNPTNLNWGGLGSNQQVYQIAYHPRVANLVFVGTSQGLYRSTDNLQSFTRYLPNANVTHIAFHPLDDQVIYIYDDYHWGNNGDVILVSDNGGTSFTSSATLTNNNGNRVQIATSPACPDCLYAASSVGVWKSWDKGDNFTFTANPSGVCDGFAVHNADTSNMIYGMLDIFASNDGGFNWNQVTWWAINNPTQINAGQYVHADLREIACINGTYYIGTDGFLCKSSDKGQTWQILTQDQVGIRENYALGVSQSKAGHTMTGSQDNGTSIFNGQQWVEFYGADGMESVVHPLNPNWMMGSVQFGTRRLTRDGGISQRGATPAGQSGYWEAPLEYNHLNHLQLYHFGEALYFSPDFGDSWQQRGYPNFHVPGGSAESIRHAATAFNDSSVIAVARFDDFELSLDGGQTFRRRSIGLPNRSISGIAFAPHNDSIIVLTYGSYQADNQKVFISYDQAMTWQNITANLGDMPIHSAVISPYPGHHIFLGGEIGVYTKALHDTAWVLYNTDLPNATMNDLDIVWGTSTLRGATWGRGMWETDLPGRSNYPSLEEVLLANAPGTAAPKASVHQKLSVKINYSGSLDTVYLRYSVNSIRLDSVMALQAKGNGWWESQGQLPAQQEGDLVYFQVFAVGAQQDTSFSFRYNYQVQPFEYCAAAGANNTTVNYINQVSLANLVHSSAKDGYGDFTNLYANLDHSTNYSLQVGMQHHFDQDTVYAWVDWNKDRDFDSSELILFGPIDPNHQSFTNLQVPFWVGTDTLRLRVRSRYWNGGPDPCGTHTGEVEDYSIIINGSGLDLSEKNGLTLSAQPNPFANRLSLQKDDPLPGEISIYRPSGSLFETLNWSAAAPNLEINTSSWPTGVYFCQFRNAEGTASLRLIKQ